MQQMTLTDTDRTAMSTALAVFMVGQLELQMTPLLQRIDDLERRAGIVSSAYDVQSQIPVEQLAERLRGAMVNALAARG